MSTSSSTARTGNNGNAASTKLAQAGRTFRFVEYGQPYVPPDDAVASRPTISCDGRVPGGVTLELTHWADNLTPDEYYADTSTEMALKLPIDVLPDAVVLNNHYDTDGVLSVFACLYPELAREHAALLKAGAEAGDFGEWSSDGGIKLDAILCELPRGTDGGGDEEAAYRKALDTIPDVLRDLTETGGEAYRDMWEPVLDEAYRGWKALQDGSVAIELRPYDGKARCLAVVTEPPEFALPAYSLHRGLMKATERRGASMGAIARVLRVSRSRSSNDLYHYVYQKPGHGWVQRLVDRSPVPGVDAAVIVRKLNEAAATSGEGGGGQPNISQWKVGGPSGLVSICYVDELRVGPEKVSELLMELDGESMAATAAS